MRWPQYRRSKGLCQIPLFFDETLPTRDGDYSGGVAGRIVRFYVENELVGIAKKDPGGNAYLNFPTVPRIGPPSARAVRW